MKLSIKQEILDILTVTEIFLKYNDLKKKKKKKKNGPGCISYFV